MAEIRTLTTLFDFRTDTTGLKVYEESIARIKGLAMEVGKMFGLYFAIDKISEYVGEVVNAGKEMARINAQITMMARSQDDAQAATTSLYNIAQNLGIEYKEIAETYKGFLVDVQDSKVSQEELLTATENVYKALRVGRTSAEEMGAAVMQIERGLRLGRFERRTIGRLIETPGLQQLLLAASGQKNIDALRDLAKQGKITGEQMIEWLSKPNIEMQRQFEQLPQRIDWVFKRIFNQLTYAASEVWKLSEGFATLGKVIWWVFSAATNVVKWFINALGGLRLALQYIGIALALVIGPYMLRQAILMTAQFIRMALASWSIWLPWLAIGAAIVVAALAIQDFMIWMSGDKRYRTRFGTWLGPFEEFKKKLSAMFEDMPLVKLFRSLQDFFTGDMAGGFKKLTEALGEPKKLLEEMLVLVGTTLPAAFVGWNILKFTGIIGALGVLRDAIIGVKTEAETTKNVVESVGKAKPGASIPGQGSLPLSGVTTGEMVGGAAIASRLLGQGAGFALLGAGAVIKDWSMTDAERKTWSDKIDENRNKPWLSPVGKDVWDFVKGVGERAWYGPESIRNQNRSTGQTAPGTQPSSNPGDGRGGTGPFSMGLNNAALLSSLMTMGAIPFDFGQFKNGIAPGPPPAPNIPITVQQTNNITATMQPDEAFMADMIEKKIQSTAPDLAGQISRQIQDATPRTEKATQF